MVGITKEKLYSARDEIVSRIIDGFGIEGEDAEKVKKYLGEIKLTTYKEEAGKIESEIKEMKSKGCKKEISELEAKYKELLLKEKGEYIEKVSDPGNQKTSILFSSSFLKESLFQSDLYPSIAEIVARELALCYKPEIREKLYDKEKRKEIIRIEEIGDALIIEILYGLAGRAVVGHPITKEELKAPEDLDSFRYNVYKKWFRLVEHYGDEKKVVKALGKALRDPNIDFSDWSNFLEGVKKYKGEIEQEAN